MPTTYVVLRPYLETIYVGPFASEAEAKDWQAADTAAHGDPGEFSVWPLFSPEDATASAIAAKGG